MQIVKNLILKLAYLKNYYYKSCDQMIKEIKRLGDYESFHVCDQEKCFKYFENEAKYNSHIDQIHS